MEVFKKKATDKVTKEKVLKEEFAADPDVAEEPMEGELQFMGAGEETDEKIEGIG